MKRISILPSVVVCILFIMTAEISHVTNRPVFITQCTAATTWELSKTHNANSRIRTKEKTSRNRVNSPCTQAALHSNQRSTD